MAPKTSPSQLHSVFDAIDARHAQATRPTPQLHRADFAPPFVSAHEESVIQNRATGPVESDLARATMLAEAVSSPDAVPQTLVAKAGKFGQTSGSAQVVALSTGDTAPQSLFQAVGDDTGAEMMTVTLGQPLINSPNGASTVWQATCLVEYGAGKVQSQVQIDWVQGLSFQVPGSFVRVSAILQACRGSGGDVVTFTAFVSRRPRSRTSRLVKTIFTGALGVGNGFIVGGTAPFPAGVTEVQFVFSGSATNVQLIYTGDSLGRKSYGMIIPDSKSVDTAPRLPMTGAGGTAGNSFLTVTNPLGSAGSTDNGALVFTVEL